MNNNTVIPLKVHYVKKREDLPSPLVEGTLYFIGEEKSIYKETKPMSGINRVTAVEEIDKVTLKFNDNYGTDGNVLTVTAAPSSLYQVVLNLIQRVDQHDVAIQFLNSTNNVCVDLDKVSPLTSGHYTLKSAVTELISLDLPYSRKNSSLMYNDGLTTRWFIYTSADPTTYDNLSCWHEIQIGQDQEIKTVKNKLALPAIGTPKVLYICKAEQENYFWDDDNLCYKLCGFTPDNIKFINSNF